jgi:hypothetical protein
MPRIQFTRAELENIAKYIMSLREEDQAIKEPAE